jgi:cytochrome oxidase Cu insertion factor (SCO1/SenC/PrrC family)
LLLVLLVCASPLIFSYLTYYVIKPAGRNNYGALIDPRAHPIPPAPALALRTLDGKPVSLEQYRGKWVMLQSGPSACPERCQQQLYAMRQLRLMQGREMERIERVWLITDNAPLETLLIREFDGTDMLRAPAAALKAWLPVEAGGNIDDHLYLVDPMGHLMMRFPKDANPAKVKNDINKLLKASAIG